MSSRRKSCQPALMAGAMRCRFPLRLREMAPSILVEANFPPACAIFGATDGAVRPCLLWNYAFGGSAGVASWAIRANR